MLVLVTGGTGTLGRVVVAELLEAGQEVRVLSRRPKPSASNPAVRWQVGNLRTAEGLAEAVAGAGTIVHCATGRGDLESTRHLIDAALTRGAPHLSYISIVGVDKVPFAYYRSKLATERLIAGSGLPWSTLRTTQFHNLVLRACESLAKPPLMFVPAGLRFQPIEVTEVAARLVEIAVGGPAGRVPDVGGPQVRSARGLALSYLEASGRHRPVASVRLPGKTFAAFGRGAHLAPERAVGRITFEEFLTRQPLA